MNTVISRGDIDLVSGTSRPVRDVVVMASIQNSFASALLQELRRLQPGWRWHPILDGVPEPQSSWIVIPELKRPDGVLPDLDWVRLLFQRVQTHSEQARQVVLLSSALIYGTGPGRTPFMSEEHSPYRNGCGRISQAWSTFESLAREHLQKPSLTILRPAIVLGSSTVFSRTLSHRLVPTLPGHDPVLQLLSLSDLASAMVCALGANKSGIFNVAPQGVVPMHAAIRLRKSVRVPIPRTLRRAVTDSETLDLLRYPATVAGAKIREELGFVPEKSSVRALLDFCNPGDATVAPEPPFDDFGMDRNYIRFYGKSLFRLVSDYYWRIEDKGLEHIPAQGRAILVGMHRGFMPFDGVMALHTVVRRTGRYPRFLTHPGLLKFPFLANFMTKLGGVVACQESADRVLGSNELLGIFPEGIHGAFSRYRHAYTLRAFGRDAFVKLALRHSAPIIPFVTVGSAEIFPIFGKITWHRWTRYADWPFIPITPTFPLLPLPLPSKWHTQFLPPVQVAQYPPEAAGDAAIVKALSQEVRLKMQQAVDVMLSKRPSIFFGSIFGRRIDEGNSKSVAI